MQIIESQYFGCVNYWISISENSVNEISLYDRYQKMTFCNRTVIVGSNGLIDLSIPIEGGRNCGLIFKDVKIDVSQNWKQRHWKSILSSYGKAPFFEFYRSDVERLIFSNNIYLFDYNYKIILWVLKVLKLKTSLTIETEENDKTTLFQKAVNIYRPSNFQEKTYNYQYVQVFENKLSFQYNVSILDLIFCEGPSANNLLISAGL